MPLDDFLDHRCDVTLQAAKQGRSGAPGREPHAPIFVDVPCGLREMGGGSGTRDGKATMTGVVRVYIEPESLGVGFALTTRHRLEVYNPLAPGGEPRILTPVSTVNVNSLDRLLQVDCEEQPV